jgi:hypothetical protein
VADHLPSPERRETVAANAVVPAVELDPGIFARDGWRLVLAEDGWYLVELGDQTSSRITTADAVARIGKYGRAPVFKATRQYIAELGRALAEGAYLSATASARSLAEDEMRRRGLDPKLPSEQIARAGHIIGRLGDELAVAEAAPPIV